jgi:DNA sulfur modification protein DndD
LTNSMARFSTDLNMTGSALDLFSETELFRLRAKANALSSGRALTELKKMATRRQQLRRKIRVVEAHLRKFEESGAAENLLQRRASAEIDVGDAKRAFEAANALAARAEEQRKVANFRMVQIEESLAASRAGAARAMTARHARLALEEFTRRMRLSRTKSLESEASNMLRSLLHRKGALETINIRPDDFSVTLLNAQGHEIAVPSAGERELFALSLIHGFRMLARREAPLMIDTPLGRLDKTHREAIVTKFLPGASQQVLVLATDSEISGQLYAQLRPSIAWQAMLLHSPKKAPQIDVGAYFDEERLP